MPNISQSLYDALVAEFAPAAGDKWDASAKGSHVALSNGDLTASTDYYDYWQRVRSEQSRSSGVRVFKATLLYGAPASFEEICVGLSTASWDASQETVEKKSADLFSFMADGSWRNGESYSDSVEGGLVPSGEAVIITVDFDNGTITAKNEANVAYASGMSFTPNTPLHVAATFYAEPGAPVSVSLDLDYSEPGKASWNS